MKVLDLACAQGHPFEGWFGSEADFVNQNEQQLISCPLCDNHAIKKLLSAPRLNLSGAQEPKQVSDNTNPLAHTGPASPSETGISSPHNSLRTIGFDKATTEPSGNALDMLNASQAHAMSAQWLEVAKQVIAHTEDVGSQFAAEARKMHYGEVKERSIRGQTSLDDARALLDEGIDVMPFVVPPSLKKPLQ